MNAPIQEDVLSSNAWPFQEAQRVLQRAKHIGKTEVLFETGYGPSGLPHIGTFGEVVRTSMVRHAFSVLTSKLLGREMPSRLICFSDDMDGLRKIPDNIPNADKIRPFLNFPLTQVPDPFGTFESFGHHNNNMLKSFLDSFGFNYTFMSATEVYTSGALDEVLLRVLERHTEILEILLPTLRDERQKTYSPFLPISPSTGRVLQVPVEEYKTESGTIVFRDEDGALVEIPVTGGHCKLQWKIDWASRWVALGVDYEMSGKDLIDSVRVSTQVCNVLGSSPPEMFSYEHFLDEEGKKISKSKGNGLSVEEWLQYAPNESLSCFMYHAPRRAKRLFFDVIPRYTDEYIDNLKAYPSQDAREQLNNPVWHIHNGHPPHEEIPIGFGMLLSLASAANATTKDILWGFISRYSPGAHPERMPFLDALVGHAVRYYQDFIAPHKKYREPTPLELEALVDLHARFLDISEEEGVLQTEIYEVGKRHPFPDLKAWFSCLYEVLLGQKTGPRMGSFFAILGLSEARAMLKKVIDEAVLLQGI